MTARRAFLATLEILRDLSPDEAEAWLRCGERSCEGMPVDQAAAMMWQELGRTPPGNVLDGPA